ncbi:MAG: regulatory protein RecX [Flavobacteriales bacterium]
MDKKNYNQVKLKLSRWCSRQDQCVSKARQKAKLDGLNDSEIDQLIDELLDLDFLNEARFAEAFVRGKMNQKLWGEVKVQHHLRQLRVDGQIIQNAINEYIAKGKTENNLRELIAKKKRLDNPAKPSLVRFLQGKGYRLDDILKALD